MGTRKGSEYSSAPNCVIGIGICNGIGIDAIGIVGSIIIVIIWAHIGILIATIVGIVVWRVCIIINIVVVVVADVAMGKNNINDVMHGDILIFWIHYHHHHHAHHQQPLEGGPTTAPNRMACFPSSFVSCFLLYEGLLLLLINIGLFAIGGREGEKERGEEKERGGGGSLGGMV